MDRQNPHTSHDPIVVDCASCLMAETSACDDCVVTYLTAPAGPLVLEAEERRAIDALAEEGLVPRLRLVPGGPPRSAAG